MAMSCWTSSAWRSSPVLRPAAAAGPSAIRFSTFDPENDDDSLVAKLYEVPVTVASSAPSQPPSCASPGPVVPPSSRLTANTLANALLVIVASPEFDRRHLCTVASKGDLFCDARLRLTVRSNRQER